jgi:ribosome-associated translation inhibitor RaiA
MSYFFSKEDKMNLIKEKINKIYEKYNEYITFDYTIAKDNNGKRVDKWTIYMSDIGHNAYTDKEQFLAFLDLIINTELPGFLETKLELAKERLEYLTEAIRDKTKEISFLEKTLNNYISK